MDGECELKGIVMENTDFSAEAPIACSLESGAFRERLAWIADLNRAALLDAQREGLRLILTYRRDHADQVREMVRREQQCCAFLGFELQVGDDSVTLAIAAPESAADALDAVFEPFLPSETGNAGCGCTATRDPGRLDHGCN